MWTGFGCGIGGGWEGAQVLRWDRGRCGWIGDFWGGIWGGLVVLVERVPVRGRGKPSETRCKYLLAPYST